MLRPYFMGKVFNCSQDCLSCKEYYKKNDSCKKYTCKYCGLTFRKGDKVIKEIYTYRDKNRVEYKDHATYHVDCYMKQLGYWVESVFDKLESISPKKQRGRPKKYPDGKLVNQLRALRRYHVGVGNTEAIMELDKKLEMEGSNANL